MTDTRTRAVQTLTERLGLDLAEANEIIVCLLAETITEAETRTRQGCVAAVLRHRDQFTAGPYRDGMSAAVWAIKQGGDRT